jgi:crotonobetainyl-CoA:carnitine CoA-transferase CaiB-like acyl-CoA transferase
VAVGTQPLWQRLLRLLNLEDELGMDPRFSSNADRIQNRDELIAILQRHFDLWPSSEWVARLTTADIPVARIQTVGEALQDPQALSRGLVVEIRHPTLDKARSIANPIRSASQPVLYRLPPPLLGEHNSQILCELGFPKNECESVLRDACTALPAHAGSNV